jgi:hypothetical protein
MKKVSLYFDEQIWEDFRVLCLREHLSASQRLSLCMVQALREAECSRNRAAEAETSP